MFLIQILHNETNAACAIAIRNLYSDDDINLSQIMAIPGCPDLYIQFTSSCGDHYSENIVSWWCIVKMMCRRLL